MRYPRLLYRLLAYVLALALILVGGVFYMNFMPGTSHTGRMPSLTREEAQLGDRLRQHIRMLGGDIGERNIWREGTLLMVADTALFRYPHYHAATDTPDKIDYERLARVVSGLGRVIEDLAQRGP